MTEFRVVDDSMRGNRAGGREIDALAKALLAGATLVVPLREGETPKAAQHRLMGHYHRICRRRGFKLHTRQGADGIITWAEPLGEEA